MAGRIGPISAAIAALLALLALSQAPAAETVRGERGAAKAPARLPGIDVSRFQERIEWELVADGGIRFAIVQASRGDGGDCAVKPERCGPDRFYGPNLLGAVAEGIRVGAYHRAFVGGDGRAEVKADAKAEAAVFLGEVEELERGSLLPALDVEPPFAGLNANELVLWVRTWLRRVEAKLGAKPMIYTSESAWDLLGDTTEFAAAGHPLWVANWEVRKPAMPAANWGGLGWRIWQHSSRGEVAGINGNVDLDWLRGGWRGLSVR